MRRKLRIVNILFWIAVWAGIITVTKTWNDGVLIALEAVAPLMVGLFVHIALRDEPGSLS
jgi:hypothetical protein